MKPIEALERINRSRASSPAETWTCFLACGFTPLHLATFLEAYLIGCLQKMPAIETGLYGDLPGNLERAAARKPDAVAVVIEWADLDARLGFRQLGGWSPQLLPDIEATAGASLQRLKSLLTDLAAGCPVVLSTPTLSLPPVAPTSGWEASGFELRLAALVNELAVWAAGQTSIRQVNRTRLDLLSPLDARLDLRSEIRTGLPYTQEHADILARLIAKLLIPTQPVKGLIVGRDDTLWNGILGEVGVDGVRWDLESRSHIHALFQQLLDSLAEAGTLIAIASKNDAALVEAALARADLHIKPDRIFPVHANWGPKSDSVSRILQSWNIGADAVLFVDDNPMELAEVKAAHPGIECVQFPRQEPSAGWELLWELRDRFGKRVISEEDRIRLATLRTRPLTEAPASAGAGADEFLAQAQGGLTFQLC